MNERHTLCESSKGTMVARRTRPIMRADVLREEPPDTSPMALSVL